jgi:hypothetical protein
MLTQRLTSDVEVSVRQHPPRRIGARTESATNDASLMPRYVSP